MTRIARMAVVVLAVSLVGGAGRVLAQQPSLAEVARQAAESRKARDKATKTYTNDDLKGGRPLTVSGPAAEASKPAAEAKAGTPARATEDTSKRAEELRAYVAERKLEAERLQRRVADLNDSVLNSFSHEQRQALLRDRDAAIDEFRKVQLDIEAQSKAAADLEAAPAPPAAAPEPEPKKPQ